MSGYVRPPLELQVFHNESGNVINYGDRWTLGEVLDDNYSSASNPERFRPILDVADALIAYLVDSYDVSLHADIDPVRPAGRGLEPRSPVRIIRLTPSDITAASLTFLFWPHPSLTLHAGLMTDFPYPYCGCDHCDEDVVHEVERLEQQVLAVVDGDLSEALTEQRPPWRRMNIRYEDGEESGSGIADHLTAEDITVIRTRLAKIADGRWSPWPVRATT